MPNNKYGFKQRPDEKFQPKTAGGYEGNYDEQGHDFNIKGKSVRTEGSDYHDLGRKDSGLYGNFKEKDSSLEYLRNRNKEGQEVRSYSATSREAKLKTFGGVTAYDSRPIPETYQCATSNGIVGPNAVQYKTDNKDRNSDEVYTQDTESNELTKKETQHLKSK